MKVLLLLAAVLAVFVALGIGIYLAERPRSDEYITTPSGLRYKDLKIGEGKEVKPGDTVTVHYIGWLKDGKEFDKSGNEAVTYPLKDVVPGWQEGLPGMKVGGKRKLIVPPDLAYGNEGKPGIPPNSTLTFEVEIVDVK